MLTVGVCTYRRASLADTLRSLAAQRRPADRIVVADNDEAPSARGLCEAAAGQGAPVVYVHAPARNIAIARNACLERADGLLAFIDDDETAPPGWLDALTAALTPGLAGVSGPSVAVYPEGAPAWMRALSPHSQRPPAIHERDQIGHTANCLLDPAHPALAGLRFDSRFGRSGGEDTDYFQRAFARGARFGVADAPVFEPVPPERLSAAWLAERRRRAGRAWLASLPARRRRTALAALPKVAWCRGRAAAARGEEARRAAWLRGLFHEGVVSAGLGVRPSEHYGALPDGAGAPPPSQTLQDRSR